MVENSGEVDRISEVEGEEKELVQRVACYATYHHQCQGDVNIPVVFGLYCMRCWPTYDIMIPDYIRFIVPFNLIICLTFAEL